MRNTNQKMLYSAAVVLSMIASSTVLFSGCGLFSKGHFVTELYQYFPKESSFFIEFKPSEQDAQKMLSAIDKLASRSGVITNQMSGKHARVTNQAQQITHQVTQVFNKDFESQMAIGYWITDSHPAGPEPKSETPKSAILEEHSLAVLPLKAGVTFETLEKDLKLAVLPATNIKTDVGDVKAYPEKNNKLLYSVTQDKLFITQDTKTLVDSLACIKKSDKYLLASELVEKNLGRLAGNRQGTVVFQQSKSVKALQDAQLESMAKRSAQRDFATQLAKQFEDLSSGSVGGLSINTDKLLVALDMYTPMDFTKIKNETLRSHLQTFYTQNGKTNLADTISDSTVLGVGVNGLDQLISIYENILKNTPEASNNVETAKSQLKSIGLDWQQNVVGMFRNTTGLVLSSQNQQANIPNVALLLNNSPETQKTMDTLVKKISPLAGSPVEKTLNGKKLSVLSSPLLPAGIAFGDVGSGFYALGLSQSVESLPSLSSGKSLSSSPAFQALSDGVAKNVIFFVFANWSELARQIPQFASTASLPLDSVLMSGSWENGVSHGQFRFKLDANKI